MGGTFDHLHLGHRLLLTQACLITKDVLYVGVTADSILAQKAYAGFIEPYEVRKGSVERLLKRLAPNLQV